MQRGATIEGSAMTKIGLRNGCNPFSFAMNSLPSGPARCRIAAGTFGKTTHQHLAFKWLHKGNLQNHMTPMEMTFQMLGDQTTTELHRERDSQGVPQLRRDAKEGGRIAGQAREVVEQQLGTRITSPIDYHAKVRGDAVEKAFQNPQAHPLLHPVEPAGPAFPPPMIPFQARDPALDACAEAIPPATGRGMFERAALGRHGARGGDDHVAQAVPAVEHGLPVFHGVLEDLVSRDTPVVHQHP